MSFRAIHVAENSSGTGLLPSKYEALKKKKIEEEETLFAQDAYMASRCLLKRLLRCDINYFTVDCKALSQGQA
jgi:hypothetical protein